MSVSNEKKSTQSKPISKWKLFFNNYIHMYKTAIAGGLAGSMGKSVTAPLSRMTLLYQVNPELAKHSLLSAYQHVLTNEGILAFWKGNLMSVMHRFPYSAINFTLYEHVRKIVCSKSCLNTQENISIRFMCGSISAAAACVTCYPLEILRTRLTAGMNIDIDAEVNGQPSKKPNVTSILRNIIKYEGFKGLFRGLGMSIAVAVPNIGTSFAVYGTAKDYFLHSTHVIHKERFCDAKTGKFTLLGGLLTGSLSAILSSLLIFPFDTIRKRLQVGSNTVKNGVFNEMASIIKHHDGSVIRGLYKGIIPELLRVIPMVATTFATYELCMNKFEPYNNDIV